jgi:hypothetical protein
MAVTRFKSSLSTQGTICAGYYGDANGTAYGMMQGLGTAYKIMAGTAQLSAGSVNVTTSLSRIVYAVAGCTNGTAPVNATILKAGTVTPACVYLNSAGTLAIVASDASAISGTAIVCWHAIGY